MKQKLYLSICLTALALLVVSLSIPTFEINKEKLISRLVSEPNDYRLTLNDSNAPVDLTDAFQKKVSSTVTTNLGNEITIVCTNAKSLNNGYVLLGNHGTVYCCTDGDDHISGLTSIKAVFASGVLKIKSSSVNTLDGSSYITDEGTLTNNVAYDLPAGANSFVLEAQDANVSISQIQLTYSCSTSEDAFDFTQTYDVENFESYSATGIGYDGSHGMATATNLRSSFYSTYNGSGSDPLNGSGWNIMGSSDYLTFNNTIAYEGNNCALMKVNSGNYFSYIQNKHFFGVPTAIGKGNRLSVWMHGGYTDTAATTLSSNYVEVTLIAYYNKQLNTAGSNDAAKVTYTVLPRTDWGEYTLDLDSSKTIYAFGIHLKKASGTVYIPIDNVKIYSTSPYLNSWPTGTFVSNITVLGNSMPVLFAFSDQRKVVTVKIANNTDAGVTGYSYNESTHQFTITTSGSYSGKTYGTITGIYDVANNRLTNINLSGSIKSYVSNNGSIIISAPTRYWNCDGSTSTLQSIFKRRYGGTVDTGNADRITYAPYARNSGYNGMRIRLWNGGLTQLNLQNDISVSCGNISFWVYSTFTEDKTIRLWTYTGANLTNNTEIGSVTAIAGQWTFVCMGFGKSITLRNFQIAFDSYDPNLGAIFLDDICLYL